MGLTKADSHIPQVVRCRAFGGLGFLSSGARVKFRLKLRVGGIISVITVWSTRPMLNIRKPSSRRETRHA